MAGNSAEGVRSTGVGRVTGVGALAVDTGEVGWAVGARPAAKNTCDTCADLLAVAVLIPPTERLTDAIITDFVDVAGLVVETDVLAELAVTDLSLWALGVGRARLGLSDTTNHRSWVGDEGGRAGALGTVVDHLTGGAGATGVTTAGVRAPVVDAGVGLWAV